MVDVQDRKIKEIIGKEDLNQILTLVAELALDHAGKNNILGPGVIPWVGELSTINVNKCL